MIGITTQPIDVAQALQDLDHPQVGGICTFMGTVRNHNHGRQVLYLEYEAYPEMAVQQLERLAESVRDRWPAVTLVLIHRTGRLEIGEMAVFVGVGCAHRDAAFEACRYAIEAIKHDLPIWKKETFVGGEAWVEGCGHPLETVSI